MGLFEKVDYDEIFTKLSSKNMTSRELRKAEKALDKLVESGDKRGILWRPLISIRRDSDTASHDFSVAERECGICEEYVRVRSLPFVFGLFSYWYDRNHDPISTVFVARAYENGWGVEKDHEKALEIIQTLTENPNITSFNKNRDLIKDAYFEIVGKELTDSETSEQKVETHSADIAENQSDKNQPSAETANTEIDLYRYPNTNTVIGVLTFPKGDYYEGNVYEGEFYVNEGGYKRLHGYGKMYYENGETWDGEWEENEKVSLGLHTFPDGRKQAENTRMGVMYVQDMEREAVQKRLAEVAARTEKRNLFLEKNKSSEASVPSLSKTECKRVEYAGGDIYEGEMSDGNRHVKGEFIYASAPVSAQDTSGADGMSDDEWEEFATIKDLHEKFLHPELFVDPRDRYISNSCMYLRPFVKEFREEFEGDDYAETKDIIAEILGVESDELTKNIENCLDFIGGFTEKEYLLAAMDGLAYTVKAELTPYLANLAYFLWKDTGDGDYFEPLFTLFKLSCEYNDDDNIFFCAMLRIQENGNLDELLKPDYDGSYDNWLGFFDLSLEELLKEGYLPGADGKMYLPGNKNADSGSDDDDGGDTLINYKGGDSYRGAVVDGKREGFGVYQFASGWVYRGSFHADNYDGYGILDEGNGKVYKGLWKDDVRCGYGEQIYANGEIYRGWWKDNRYHGFGRYEFANGEVYVGEFFGGMRHGISLMRRSNGKWYGERWNNDDILPSPTGPRVLNNKDGSRYVGAVTERHIGNTTYISHHGFGELRFSDVNSSDLTDCYVGQFVNGSPCGTGVCIYAKGETPYIMASNDFRADSLPEGECRAISVHLERNFEYAKYYVGGFHDQAMRGRGTLYLIGSGEHQYADLYGLKSGSIACCNTFDIGPDGAAVVTDVYGKLTNGRFVNGLWEPSY